MERCRNGWSVCMYSYIAAEIGWVEVPFIALTTILSL
jgi:hypothetical protein